MRRTVLCMLLAVVLSAVAVAQEEGVLLYAGFEKDVEGFITADNQGELAVFDDADNAFKGKGALELWYAQRAVVPGQEQAGLPGSLILPIANPLTDLRAISFALNVQLPANIVVSLGEGDEGPRYNCMLRPEPGKWCQYELTTDEFQFDNNGPVDPNGKLDLGSVNAIVIMDADSFIRAMAVQMPIHVNPPDEQTIWLDEFRLLSKAPDREKPDPTCTKVADYDPPLHGMMIIGGSKLDMSFEDVPEGGKAAKADYAVPGGTLFALIHQVPDGGLVGAKALRLRIKAAKPGMGLINLEEQTAPGDENKAGYSATFALDTPGQWKTVLLDIGQFKLGDDQIDANGKLDLEHVRMIMLIEPSALMTGEDVQNTVWLDELAAIK